ncbi:pyridoxal phosphate-dependent aminotransferase [Desulfatibacillum aliphaticivorans]|uniref:pyridoxal phosphate-dependent aminotransferase n=1 Tax=Desulfatibacillum aliphaticivorans TaxID=218208 RepID=UPI00041DD392|nr:aminotransferase class I/II-fold pyridoxal phosphate-dependent enzyme [Desulfatibacillum aliphaticivorans]
MRPVLNPLVLSLKESATLAINLRAKELRKQGKDIVHFGFGQSPFPVPEVIQKALAENTDKKDYLPTQGLPELCEAVAGFYNKEFGYDFLSSNVCVGPGSKELIFEIIYLVEGPLLVPVPSWVSYGPQAALRGKEIITIPTNREYNYRLTPEALDKACYEAGQKQKLLIFNNPNNPTGALYHEKEIKELAEICKAYQVIVISDEIYAMLEYDKWAMSSLALHYPEGTIVSGGLSKSFAAGGYRLGVALIPDSLELVMNSLKAVISETFSAVSAPIQHAALAAYGDFENVRPFVQKTRDIYRHVMHYLHDEFTDMGLNCPRPAGAFYAFPDFDKFRSQLAKKNVITAASLSHALLEEVGVAVLPGSDFYLPATNLGVRVAGVDFDGQQALDTWPGRHHVTEEYMEEVFPNLVHGCERISTFLNQF